MPSFRKDRGMAKWQGFLLSEHAASMEVAKHVPTWQKVMDQEKIYQVLHQVLQHRATIVIQLFKSEGETPDPYIEGRIVGVEGEWLYVQTELGTKKVEIALIRFVDERSFQKWYDK
ncbi:hypothetical protein [Listeria newyorkensis]|uniref:hypothetical protein n=1 Tax=Listeria newyorkensis TaxID=1497681 RepID=UPI00051DC287|nr:hypothetical protein [Listeria newyorkensis]KGL43560.1 hypothetical protein EP58_07415 [Listeria newyorkensis]